jgi:hypothetical protein
VPDWRPSTTSSLRGADEGTGSQFQLRSIALRKEPKRITPAISVLSAIEGLGVASPAVTPYVVPIAAVVLGCLFLVLSRGSGAIGFLFGPVMAVWFATLAIAGVVHLLQYPGVLFALSPIIGRRRRPSERVCHERWERFHADTCRASAAGL